MTARLIACFSVISLVVSPALGQFISGSDGSDGAFTPTMNTTIDLSQAATAAWDAPSPVPSLGVHDSAQWAVVFKYTIINIPVGVTVTFLNHPKGAPVVWLAQGDITIDGTVNLGGTIGSSTGVPAKPGPGGFAGGIANLGLTPPASGFGPGGAGIDSSQNGIGGSYATPGLLGTCGDPGTEGPTYGNVSIIPLIGGSGGSGSWWQGRGGGAGGGAILIASSSRIVLTGLVFAAGGAGTGFSVSCVSSSIFGGGGGSGGAIRLIAPEVTGTGQLLAGGGAGANVFAPCCDGGAGGDGRIRVEASTITLTSTGDPPFTCGVPGPVFPPAITPTLRVTQIAGQAVPTDPDAGVLTADVAVTAPGPATVTIEASNIPLGTTVEVRVMPERGSVINTVSTPLVGTTVLSTATASVTFPFCRSEIQLKANWTP